jgi:hypothetical protein
MRGKKGLTVWAGAALKASSGEGLEGDMPCYKRRKGSACGALQALAAQAGEGSGTEEEDNMWVVVGLAAGPAAIGPAKRTITFLIYSNFQTELNLIRSKGGLPELENFKIKYVFVEN